MASEKKLDNKVINYIESKGGWIIKYWAGAKYTKKGIPDLLACVNGYFLGIEDKGDNGRPKMLQLKNLEWIDRAGGFGILLYPKDFNNFKRFVDELCEENNDLYLTDWQMQWYSNNILLQLSWRDKLEKN